MVVLPLPGAPKTTMPLYLVALLIITKLFKFFYSPLFVVKDLYDAEDYARFAISDEEYNQRPAEYAQMTKGQYLSATFSSRVGISPKAWHQPFWFGLGIGKSF